MSYQEFQPRPLLAPYIKCLWIVERDFQPLNGSIDILPDSSIEVIFNFGDACQIDVGGNYFDLPSAYVVTLFNKPFRLHTTGVLKTIGVRFFPWGLAPLMQLDLNPTLPVHTLDTQWQNFTERIQYVCQEEALSLLQQRFVQPAISAKINHVEVQMTSQLLFDHQGEGNIDELAQYCHVSRRQLERKFRTIVGVSPKMLARYIRFEHVRNRLCYEPDHDLSILADEYGYADQAHLSRDFKELSGRTLRQFMSEIRAVQADLRFGVAFPDIKHLNS